MEQQELMEKIKQLPPDQVAKVQDFVDSLVRHEQSSNRMNLHQAITNYAIKHAGTEADIDPDLDFAATAHLFEQDSEK